MTIIKCIQHLKCAIRLTLSIVVYVGINYDEEIIYRSVFVSVVMLCISMDILWKKSEIFIV